MSGVWEGIAQRLEGKLVVLEPLTPEHADGLRLAAAGPGRLALCTVHGHRPTSSTSGSMDARERGSGDRGPFADHPARERRADRQLEVHDAPPRAPRPRDRLDVARARAWGTGVNVEAKLLLLAHAFDDLGCMRVEFKTDALKRAVARGARSAARALRRRSSASTCSSATASCRDSAYYAITDDEWPAVRANLERRLESR